MTRRPVICRCMNSASVISGRDEVASPESITTVTAIWHRLIQIIQARVYGSRVSLRSPGMTPALHHGELLQVDELSNPLAGEREQCRELLLTECDLLGGRLYFDQIARACHHEVRIRVGLG